MLFAVAITGLYLLLSANLMYSSRGGITPIRFVFWLIFPSCAKYLSRIYVSIARLLFYRLSTIFVTGMWLSNIGHHLLSFIQLLNRCIFFPKGSAASTRMVLGGAVNASKQSLRDLRTFLSQLSNLPKTYAITNIPFVLTQNDTQKMPTH